LESYNITGFEEFIDVELDPTEYSGKEKELRNKFLASRIPRMQAVYSLGITGGYSLAKQWLPTMSDVAFKAAEAFRRQCGQAFTSASYTTMWKSFYNQMLMFIMTDNELFGTEVGGKTALEKRNYYIHDFPMKYKDFCTKTDGKGHYIH